MSGAAATVAYIGLGANLGDAAATVRQAAAALGALPDSEPLTVSSLYLSAPVGYLDQPDFINAVASIATRLTPQALLAQLLQLEQHFGRARSFRNAPRTLDLDLLAYGDVVLDDAALTVPHPRLAERAFVLLPLLEIAPQLQLPGLDSVAALAQRCDQTGIRRISVSDDNTLPQS